MDPTIVVRGLGPLGRVPLHDTLRSRYVPSNLQKRFREWREESGAGVGPSDGWGLRKMLDALVRDGALSKRDKLGVASGKAQVRPKSSERCVFILNCVKQNESDARIPHGFQLPQIEQLRNTILLGGRKTLYLAKLDLSNCFWSVRSVSGMPSTYGTHSPLDGNIRPCCAKSLYTVWYLLPFGGRRCYFSCTLTIS